MYKTLPRQVGGKFFHVGIVTALL